MKSASLGAILLALHLAGCGSEPAPPAVSPEAGGGTDIPVAKCLAIANAKRERKAEEPARIIARQILVKYAGAKAAAPSVLRSREAACVRAFDAYERLQAGFSFPDAVSTYSDEPGAAARHGHLGSIQRSDVVEAFADVAFALGTGQISEIVETEYGFHIVQRIE